MMTRSSKYKDLVAYMHKSKKSYNALHAELLKKNWSEAMIKKAHKEIIGERLKKKKLHPKTIAKHSKEAKEILKPRSTSFISRLSKNISALDEEELVSVLTKRPRHASLDFLDELFDEEDTKDAKHFYSEFEGNTDGKSDSDVIKEAVKLAQQVVGQNSQTLRKMQVPRGTQFELEKEALEEEKKMLEVQKELLTEERELRKLESQREHTVVKKQVEPKPELKPFEKKHNSEHFQQQMADLESQLKNMDVSRKEPKNNLLIEEVEYTTEPVGERARTGITGLDPIIQGGLRRLSTTLIAGGPGSGKSIFGMQFLLQGITNYNEPGLLVTFEQGKQDLQSLYEGFGWDLSKYEKEKKLSIIRLTPEQIKKIIASGGGSLRDAVDAIGANRIVIDSMSDLLTMYKNDLSKRGLIIDFFQLLHKFKCTSLIIAEQETDPSKHISSILEYQVDGVVLLYNERIGDIRQRSMEIFKMRGTRHAGRIFPMKISDKGIDILTD
jgi:circadian clock protein KaiC